MAISATQLLYLNICAFGCAFISTLVAVLVVLDKYKVDVKLAWSSPSSLDPIENHSVQSVFHLNDDRPLVLVEEPRLSSPLADDLHSERRWRPRPTDAERKEARFAALAAAKMLTSGRFDRAYELYEHALKLNPVDPDLLCSYGEFVEQHQANYPLAEQFYQRALVCQPEHWRALQNRQRLLPRVKEIDYRLLERIQRKRDLLVVVPETNAGLRRAKRENFYRYVYHTVAIEGNTLNLRQTRLIIQTGLAVHGKSIYEHNEVLGLSAALRYINSTLLTKAGPLTLTDILEIHRRVIGFADPLSAGRLRNGQVFIGDYKPPSANQLDYLMDQFVDWLNDRDNLEALHPIEFAALAHFKLVTIHPFFDGNGRTSRLLMNLLLMRLGYPPVIIPVHEREHYYETIEAGNAGNLRPFIRFVAKCTELTLDEFLAAAESTTFALTRTHGSTSAANMDVAVIEPVGADESTAGPHHSEHRFDDVSASPVDGS